MSRPATARPRFHAGALCLIACAALAAAWAEAAQPTLSNILPRGAQRGQPAEVTLIGGNLGGAVDVVFHDAGIALAAIEAVDDKNVKATLDIAPDCPTGLHALRVRTRAGVSNLMLFSVGNLPEIAEIEPNNSPDTAQEIALDTTVNGVVTNEDVDYFAVELAEGDRLAVEIEGLRLGNLLFDPKLRLFGPRGHELIAEDDTAVLRQDAGFVHVAREAGRHLIAVSESSFGGSPDSHYRLHVGRFPRPLSATPLGGAPGATVSVAWLGDPGAPPADIALDPDLPATTTLPAVNDAGVSPTGIPFRVTDLPGTVEVEPNNSPEEATPGPAPGAFDGVINGPGDVDYFRFEGAKDQVFDFRVWAAALGSPLDSVLEVFKPDGSPLASDDDGAGMDSALRATLPEDGVYTFRVRDHLRRGGEAFAYRVEVTPVTPRLRLTLAENKPVVAALPRGNQTYLLVNTSRADFDGPVRLEMPDLPEGVTARPATVPEGVTTVPVILEATGDAPVGGGLVALRGVLDDPDRDIQGGIDQQVVLVYGRNETTFYARDVDRLALAVGDPAPFRVRIVPPKAPGIVQSAMRLVVEAERAEGFADAIDLFFPWLPGGIGGGTAQIPEGADRTEIGIEFNGNAPVGTHAIFVGARAAGHQLCTPPEPIEVQEPWVRFVLPAVESEPGKTVPYAVALEHRVPFEGAVEAALFGLPKGVTAEPRAITSETEEVVFDLAVAEDAKDGKFESVGVSATLVAHGEPMVHNGYGGKITLYPPLPPELQAQAPPPAPEPEPGQPERRTRFPQT